MLVGEAEAIAAARRFADAKGRPAWRDGSVRTVRVEVRGYGCWRVDADDAPASGEPDWNLEFDGGQSYLIDADTGACIGTGLVNGYQLFVPARS